jgi:mono/diheme cytochrome c family protein
MVLSMSMRYKLSALALSCSLALGLSSCLHEDPNFIYMPDMVFQPSVKAQSEEGTRLPVKGTVPRDYVSYPYKDIGGSMPIPGSPQAKEAQASGKVFSSSDAGYPGNALRNPLRPTMSVLKRGQYVFNTYCIVCHGPSGQGDGYIVPKFPRPPTLQSDKVRSWPDGNIYHVITVGQNMMPSYAVQIAPGDRWAVIHYVRALQRSQHPNAEDIKEADKE